MKFLRAEKRGVSVWNRNRKLKFILTQFSDSDTIVDIGAYPITAPPHNGTNYLDEYFLHINRPIHVLALNRGNFSYFHERYTNCTLSIFDGRHFPDFANPFDVALSNAVVEHVGTRDDQVEWLKGIAGICNTLIITTPNRFFPVEAHTGCVLRHIFSSKMKNKLHSMGIYLFSWRELLTCLHRAGYNVCTFRKNRLFFIPLDFVVVCKPVRLNNMAVE